ncbi:hypothetical protein ACP4OV_006641 [Aristida adscensionis]
MKTSLVAALLVLLLVTPSVQGIRLDAESHAAFSKQKSGETPVQTSDSEPLGEMERTISEEKDRAGHKFPEIHVDYYGPRGHKPKHH